MLGVEDTRTEYLESFTFILLGRHAVQIRFIYCTSRSGSDIDPFAKLSSTIYNIMHTPTIR